MTASIEDAELIGRILEHRAQHGDDDLRGTSFVSRAPAAATALTSGFGAGRYPPKRLIGEFLKEARFEDVDYEDDARESLGRVAVLPLLFRHFRSIFMRSSFFG